MRSKTVSAIVVALMAASMLGQGAASATGLPSGGPVTMVITEEFCAFRTLCGTLTGSLGAALTRTVINTFTYTGDGCFDDVHTTTAVFGDGTLVVEVDGELCAGPLPRTFEFAGSWIVRSGSGRFAATSGGGDASSYRQNGPVHETLIGSFD